MNEARHRREAGNDVITPICQMKITNLVKFFFSHKPQRRN